MDPAEAMRQGLEGFSNTIKRGSECKEWEGGKRGFVKGQICRELLIGPFNTEDGLSNVGQLTGALKPMLLRI